MRKRFAVLPVIFALVLFLPGACSKSGTDKVSKGPIPSDKSASKTAAPLDGGKRKLVFGTVKKKVTVDTNNTPIVESGPGNVHGELLSLSSKGRIVPEDMVIGPLESLDNLTGEEKKAYSVIQKFFTALFSEGEDVRQFFRPESRDVQVNAIGKVSTSRIELRIGAFSVSSNGSVSAGIRIITPVGRSSGEIITEKENGVWYIGALSMDFDSLGKKYTRDGSTFEPDSYRNLELEY